MTPRDPGASAVLAVATAAIAIFFLPATELLRRNIEYFGGFRDGLYLYLAGGVVLLVGLLAWMLRRNALARSVATLIIVAGPGWLLYTALGLVTGRGWALLAATAVVVPASLALALAASEESMSRVVGKLAWIGGVLVLSLGLNIVLTTLALRDTDPPDAVGLVASAASDLPNIYHLVLDEFQTDVFEAIRDDDVDRTLRGFRYFPEAVTEYGRTEMAMATVFGQEPYRYDRPMGSYVHDAFRGPGSLLASLGDAGYATHAYLPSRSLIGTGPSPFDRSVVHSEQTPTAISSDKRRLAVSVWAFAHLPRMLSDRLLPPSHRLQLDAESLLPDDGPAISAAALRAFTEEEPTRGGSGQYVLGHFLLPHFPSVLTAGCEYERGVETGVASQSRCALRLVDDFLRELEALGRFDDALILIHGDHGAWYVREDAALRSVASSGILSEEFSHARSRPLLLVKPPGTARAGAPRLRSVPHPALLSDIAATIHAAVALGSPREPAGSSLLADDFPERPVRYYHMYEKDPGAVISGSLHRYRVVGGETRFDAEIDVPAP